MSNLSDEEKRERKRAYNKKYRADNLECITTKQKAYRETRAVTHKGYSADRALRNKYGITAEQRTQMLRSQNFLCAICDTDAPGGSQGQFHVDHCHDTGVVRGMLCHHCNVGLGHFRDNAALLLKASAYLNDPRRT